MNSPVIDTQYALHSPAHAPLHIPAPEHMPSRAPAQELSGLLLELYAGCGEMPMEVFLRHALAVIKRRLHFDSAWWGMSLARKDVHCIHVSYTEGLPPGMADLWLSARDDNLIMRTLVSQPNKTHCFVPAQIDSTEGSRWLSRQSGSRNVVSTRFSDDRLNHHEFLCLSRHDEHHLFTEEERLLKELVMPHLQAVLAMNRAAHLRRVRLQAPDAAICRAVIDRLGMLHNAEPEFIRHLHRAWPQWRDDAFLPAELCSRLATTAAHWECHGMVFEWAWTGDLALISLHPPSPLDCLSPRERLVAKAFGEGQSYKSVARQLEIEPSTVRYYLRNVYLKLGVGNKADICRLVSADAHRTQHPPRRL